MRGAGDSGGGGAGATDAGPLESLPVGAGRAVPHRGRPALILRPEDSPVALRATCTHLGCVVRWDASRGEIRCPCHGARFDTGGRVLSGPARGPLLPIPVRVEEGRILLG